MAWPGRGGSWEEEPPVVLAAAPCPADGVGGLCSPDSGPHPLHQELYLVFFQGREVNQLIFSQKEDVFGKALGSLSAELNFC